MNIISSIPVLNYFFNPSKRILGEDGRHKTWNKCYIPIHFVKKKQLPNLYKRFESNLSTELLNQESRLRLIRNGSKHYFHSKATVDTLLPLILQKVNRLDSADAINIAIRAGTSAVILVSKNGFIFCGNHLFFDGISSVQFLMNIDTFDNKGELPRLPQFVYIPLLSELKVLTSVPKYYKPSKATLRYSPSMYSDELPRNINLNIKILPIKEFKRSLGGVSFSSTMAAIVCRAIFKSTKLQTVSVGIVVAMKGHQRFNNYGVIQINVTNESTLAKLAVKIQKILEYKKDMVYATFLGANVYNMDVNFGSVDLLLSGMPLENRKKLTIQGAPIEKTICGMQYTLKPIYCMYLTTLEKLNLCYSIRSPDVNVKKMSFYTNNWRKIM